MKRHVNLPGVGPAKGEKFSLSPKQENWGDWENTWINNLDEPGYRCLQPIPVEVRRAEYGYFLASFSDANIAISGQDRDDAYQALIVEIIETFEVLLEEPKLGPDAREQLNILNKFIARI